MNQETIDDINEIFDLLGDDINKIPSEVVNSFRAKASQPRKRRINPEKDLKSQNFSKETCVMIKYISKYLK